MSAARSSAGGGPGPEGAGDLPVGRSPAPVSSGRAVVVHILQGRCTVDDAIAWLTSKAPEDVGPFVVRPCAPALHANVLGTLAPKNTRSSHTLLLLLHIDTRFEPALLRGAAQKLSPTTRHTRAPCTRGAAVLAPARCNAALITMPMYTP